MSGGVHRFCHSVSPFVCLFAQLSVHQLMSKCSVKSFLTVHISVSFHQIFSYLIKDCRITFDASYLSPWIRPLGGGLVSIIRI